MNVLSVTFVLPSDPEHTFFEGTYHILFIYLFRIPDFPQVLSKYGLSSQNSMLAEIHYTPHPYSPQVSLSCYIETKEQRGERKNTGSQNP